VYCLVTINAKMYFLAQMHAWKHLQHSWTELAPDEGFRV